MSNTPAPDFDNADPAQTKKWVRESRPCAVTCHDVFHWPEFIALAERLGIDLSKETVSLSIHLTRPDNPPVVEHVYNASVDKAGLTNAEVTGG
jgi:hypothetical protein